MDTVFRYSEMIGNDRLLMLAIADNADEEHQVAWPSMATLSRKTRIPLRTLYRCVKRCVASGELSYEKGNSERSNRYTILLRRPTQGSVTMTPPPLVPVRGRGVVPDNGRGVVPSSGTLTVIEPSVQPGPPGKMGAGDRIILDKEYDRVLEEMRAIKRTYADHQTWRTSDVDRWRELLERKKQLREKLGIKV